MNSLLAVLILVLNGFLLLVIAHWILSLFRESAGPELHRVIAVIDGLVEPILVRIRQYVRPLQMDGGRVLDLAHLVLIALILLGKYVARAIFS